MFKLNFYVFFSKKYWIIHVLTEIHQYIFNYKFIYQLILNTCIQCTLLINIGLYNNSSSPTPLIGFTIYLHSSYELTRLMLFVMNINNWYFVKDAVKTRILKMQGGREGFAQHSGTALNQEGMLNWWPIETAATLSILDTLQSV